MSFAFTPLITGIIVIVVTVAGTINGIAGFGFAVIGTMALATVIDPATAVVFMIAPILAANISLVRELSLPQLRTCGRRFAPLMLAALIGTIAGMVVLDSIPTAPLRVALGLVSLGFVITVQDAVRVPGLDQTKQGCFVETRPAMLGVGGLSGVLFGGTNVGVQLIAYIRSCDLSHGLFVGVVAMVFLGLNAVRIGAAAILGLYPTTTVVLASFAAVVPALAGVALGKRVRDNVSDRQRQTVVLGLLTLIGIRLILGGLGIT